MLYYAHQYITKEDIEAVSAVLSSDWLTQGPAIARFEQHMADYCGAKYAVAVTSATAALHIACRVAGLSGNGLLWTVPNTFVASANCGRYCGAAVDFVDIDDGTYNMSIHALKQKLEASSAKPDVVVPVHFAGQSCEMEKIYELSGKHGFVVLEDASHAVGASYHGRKVGACQFSDMAVFSFHPVKIITSGEGGMVLTNREDLYRKLVLLRNHGITRDADQLSRDGGPWYYEQQELGFNYRMTDIQAALGDSQLNKVDEFVHRRHQLAEQYRSLLADLPLRLPEQHPDADSSWHLYVVRLRLQEIRKSKKKIFEEMKQKGVALNVHYIPVHLQPYYQKLGFQAGDFPVSEQYYKEAFTLPLYYGMSDAQQQYVSDCLHEILA